VNRVAVLALAALALLALAVEPAMAAPKPRLKHTVVLKPAGGTVLVKPRGKARFKLKKATAIPLGSTVDTSNGKVKLTSALSAHRNQSGTFSQGAFVVTQQSDGLTDLTLTGGQSSTCGAGRRGAKGATGAAYKRRRLFGNAHGRFRTRGRNSSATVRGTVWSTEDGCKGTVIKNMSPSPTSKVETQTRDLQFELDPGWTVTYYCNKLTIEPDTYCTVLLARPAEGLIGGGIITQVDVPNYDLCVAAPDNSRGCFEFPLSTRSASGFRQAVFGCAVNVPGTYYFGWSLDGVNLLDPGALSLVIDQPAPGTACNSNNDPPSSRVQRIPAV
jgi:hypothetical protein